MLQWPSHVCLVLLLLRLLLLITAQQPNSDNIWNPDNDHHPCTIQHIIQNQQDLIDLLGRQSFDSRKSFPTIPPLFPEPIVIKNASLVHQLERNAYFRQLVRADKIYQTLTLNETKPNFTVTLSSSNALSEKRRSLPLSDYLHEFQSTPVTPYTQLSNESWYLFGETYGDLWKERLLQHYQYPAVCSTCHLPENAALAFGLGNQGSGVQWHTHGPGYSESVIGRKYWMLFPPSSTAPTGYHKDYSSLHWRTIVYPTLKHKPMECTLFPGEYLYFPDKWWHATINLETYTAFVSVFTTEHGIDKDEL